MNNCDEFINGEIVYHDNLMFNDESIDPKENRPCIVLFSLETSDGVKVCTCPLISSIESFNKRCNKYAFISDVIYNDRKLSFASLENVSFRDSKDTHKTGIIVSTETYNRVVNRVRNYDSSRPRTKKIYELINFCFEYIDLFDALENKENKKNKKLLRRQRRQQAKSRKNA